MWVYRYYELLHSIGIGKTTLTNEICLKWANDKDCFLSNEYDLVILIRLRAIQERTLQQAIIEAVGSEAAYDELLTKSHGERCLIILEGLDEVSARWQEIDTMFCQLVKNTVFLSCANILVTSRPHACIHLYKDIKGYARKIEIVGFDKPQIKDYAELFFHNSNTAEKFMEQVNNDPNISSFCYVPLCLNMVLECFKYNNETLHTTLTELYQSFIVSKVDEHIRFKRTVSLGTVLESDDQCFRNLATVLSDVPNVLTKGALETIFLLSKLAYKSYFEWSDPKILWFVNNERRTERNPAITYTKQYLACCHITNLESDACGLLKAINTLFATGNTEVYTFNHLSVQEYFCALYVSLLPEDQQLQLLNDSIIDYTHMWPFFAGITKLRSSIMLQYLQQYFLQDNQLEKTYFIDCKTVKKNRNVNQCLTKVLLNSIYEAQLSLNIFRHETISLFIDRRMLRPYECLSIAYFISIASIKHLFLQSCSIGDQEAEMLARCIDLIPSLKVLDLSCNNVTHKGMESMVQIIKSSTNLSHFSANYNPIGDAGIQLFSLLKFKCLIQLDVSNTKMTEVGTYALGECFKLNNSLQSLEISNNDIKDIGLTEILNNLLSTLVRLIVVNCHLTEKGALSISKILRINKTLKYLQISKNFIGDDGISAISDSLRVNTILIQLVARSCEFHSKGAENIAKMLQLNKTLKSLDISNNHIGKDGIITIAHSIQANTTLTELAAFSCKFNFKGLESVDKMLIVNSTLRRLSIAYNYGEIAAIGMIFETFLKMNCKLTQLNIFLNDFNEFDEIEHFFITEVLFEKFIKTATETARWTKHRYFIHFNDGLENRFALKVMTCIATIATLKMKKIYYSCRNTTRQKFT